MLSIPCQKCVKYVIFVKYVKYILTHYYIVAILPIVTREEIKMMYIYDPEKLDELLESIKDDDSITITGRQLRELADTIRRKGKGRKPIALDDDLFDRVVRRWQSGEITARAAMQELNLKPNTFYRRVKERYEDMDELRKELKKVAKEEKRELKELKKQVKAEAREVKDAVKDKTEDTISAHKMEKEIRKEKIAAKIDHRKEVDDLRKTVEAEVEAIKAAE